MTDDDTEPPNEPRRWAHFERRSIHRPYVEHFWYNERWWGVGLAWGNRCSDPVWCVGRWVHVPAWLARWLERRRSRDHGLRKPPLPNREPMM